MTSTSTRPDPELAAITDLVNEAVGTGFTDAELGYAIGGCAHQQTWEGRLREIVAMNRLDDLDRDIVQDLADQLVASFDKATLFGVAAFCRIVATRVPERFPSTAVELRCIAAEVMHELGHQVAS